MPAWLTAVAGRIGTGGSGKNSRHTGLGGGNPSSLPPGRDYPTPRLSLCVPVGEVAVIVGHRFHRVGVEHAVFGDETRDETRRRHVEQGGRHRESRVARLWTTGCF